MIVRQRRVRKSDGNELKIDPKSDGSESKNRRNSSVLNREVVENSSDMHRNCRNTERSQLVKSSTWQVRPGDQPGYQHLIRASSLGIHSDRWNAPLLNFEKKITPCS